MTMAVGLRVSKIDRGGCKISKLCTKLYNFCLKVSTIFPGRGTSPYISGSSLDHCRGPANHFVPLLIPSGACNRTTTYSTGLRPFIIIIIIKSYYGAPQPVLRSASQHKLRLREA